MEINNKKIMITGGAGFIGSSLIHFFINKTKNQILNLDKLTYASNLESLKDIAPKTITIAFEEEFEGVTPLSFSFIKEEPNEKRIKGVSISSDINVDDIDY